MHNNCTLYTNFLLYKSLVALALLLRPSRLAVSLIKVLHNDNTNWQTVASSEGAGGWREVGGNNWQVQASRILITNASKSKPQQLRHFFIILSADDNFQSVCAAFPPLYLPLAARCRCHTNCRNTKSCSTHTDTQRESEGCWAALRTRKEKQKQKNIKKEKSKENTNGKKGQRGNGKTFILFISAGQLWNSNKSHKIFISAFCKRPRSLLAETKGVKVLQRTCPAQHSAAQHFNSTALSH